MAEIINRGNNKFKVMVFNGFDREHKKIRVSKTFKLDPNLTEKQAEKEIKKLAIIFENEIKSKSIVDSRMTFAQFTDKWFQDYADKTLEEKTTFNYKRELETKILPAIGHIKLSDLRAVHLISFYNNLTEDGVRLDGKPGGYSSRTIKMQHQIISSILNTAVKWQLLETNVATRVSPPKGVEIKKEKYFNIEQTMRFLDYINSADLKYKTLVNLTIFSGMRKEEVLALTWNDIDFINNTVSVNKAISKVNGKTFLKNTKNESSNRVISIPQSIISMLSNLRKKSNSINIFNLSYDTPNHWLKKTIRRYNKGINQMKLSEVEKSERRLPEISFHGLRHTNATILISQGIDIKTVSNRLGHYETSTTLNTYTHFIKGLDKVASNTLDTLLNPKSIENLSNN